MCLQADCSSFESALRRLAAVAACIGDALAGDRDTAGTGTLRGLRRGRAERRTATGEVPASAGAARCCAAQQQAAHCMEQPHYEEGAEAGAGARPGAAWGPGSAAGRQGKSAEDSSGSALPNALRTSGQGGRAEGGPVPTAPPGGKRAARDEVPGLAPGAAAGHSTPGACPAAAAARVGRQAPWSMRVDEDGSAQAAGANKAAACDDHASPLGAQQATSRAGAAGSAWGAAAWGVSQTAGVGGGRGRSGPGCMWRGVSQVREGGKLRYAADIKPGKRCSQTLHLGTFATGAPLLSVQLPSECILSWRLFWQHANVVVTQLREFFMLRLHSTGLLERCYCYKTCHPL